jgi:hypothetical protein
MITGASLLFAEEFREYDRVLESGRVNVLAILNFVFATRWDLEQLTIDEPTSRRSNMFDGPQEMMFN